MDRVEKLCDAIRDAVYANGKGMPYASIFGALEIVKLEVYAGAVDD
ncbi:MAG: hypothetical protein ACRC0L_10695 [Angustibacter sp.]